MECGGRRGNLLERSPNLCLKVIVCGEDLWAHFSILYLYWVNKYFWRWPIVNLNDSLKSHPLTKIAQYCKIGNFTSDLSNKENSFALSKKKKDASLNVIIPNNNTHRLELDCIYRCNERYHHASNVKWFYNATTNVAVICTDSWLFRYV